MAPATELQDIRYKLMFFFLVWVIFSCFWSDSYKRGGFSTLRKISSPYFFNVRTLWLGCRLFVATWNVGGKTPNNGLNLEDFLQAEDSADIYVLGYDKSHKNLHCFDLLYMSTSSNDRPITLQNFCLTIFVKQHLIKKWFLRKDRCKWKIDKIIRT